MTKRMKTASPRAIAIDNLLKISESVEHLMNLSESEAEGLTEKVKVLCIETIDMISKGWKNQE